MEFQLNKSTVAGFFPKKIYNKYCHKKFQIKKFRLENRNFSCTQYQAENLLE